MKYPTASNSQGLVDSSQDDMSNTFPEVFCPLAEVITH